MSRIYEALQKAESERKTRQQYPAPQIAEHASPSTPLASSDGEAGYAGDPTAIAIAETETPYATVLSNRPSLDLSQITPKPWTLSLKQLPALLERGPAVEQFRSLRSRLFELRDIKPLKTILISSGMPQEGKSFVSTNLALSLARHKNSKVLLIDGDMRRYTVHQLLGCESFPGLADYLAGKATAVEVMQRPEVPAEPKGIAKPVLANLTFIAGGNGGDKAADLSGSPRFAELLDLVAPEFDWIIVDSSPVLPVSDAVNLARSCDGVLLVAREGVTKFQVAQRAQSELKAANLLGFVLNAVQQAPETGSYYGYDSVHQ
jgi:protein-tyrosine kinase